MSTVLHNLSHPLQLASTQPCVFIVESNHKDLRVFFLVKQSHSNQFLSMLPGYLMSSRLKQQRVAQVRVQQKSPQTATLLFIRENVKYRAH